MTPFKRGDIIKCIDATDTLLFDASLIKGNLYKVIDIYKAKTTDKFMVEVKNERGSTYAYYHTRFKAIPRKKFFK